MNAGLMLGHRLRRWPDIKPAVPRVFCSPVLVYVSSRTCDDTSSDTRDSESTQPLIHDHWMAIRHNIDLTVDCACSPFQVNKSRPNVGYV